MNYKPVKVEFYLEYGKLMQTIETFNFDEEYELITKEEGKLSLYYDMIWMNSCNFCWNTKKKIKKHVNVIKG